MDYLTFYTKALAFKRKELTTNFPEEPTESNLLYIGLLESIEELEHRIKVITKTSKPKNQIIQ